jgi:hypothetical protein
LTLPPLHSHGGKNLYGCDTNNVTRHTQNSTDDARRSSKSPSNSPRVIQSEVSRSSDAISTSSFPARDGPTCGCTPGRSHRDTAKSINICPRPTCPIRASGCPRGIPRSTRIVCYHYSPSTRSASCLHAPAVLVGLL